ncbi:UDP-N-acetylmuramate--L-alanine ligase [Paenibacillus sp. N1-5-1-14]|uniref:UDP-N-acetylmuramate--L-alanine ligase n=1 Tax=Paenibacillus radicibacter TaxID=2972488 RepID=UPI0021590E07|nr:UDP-N-acetylmuramate--L-alanine ligase [Paenibacillus radicibacter]MCR8642861.1 UDP-N-acetylmuramate--L-alanine ligase [Paenibacillus radicibacter]
MGNYHFIGIKGSGMSALAQYLHDMGHKVQGEDIETYLFTQSALDRRHIPLYIFSEAPLTVDMTVIASNAYTDEHPSLVRCKELGLMVTRYHHFVGDTLQNYTSIAVTGSHGKTTTTGMMVHTLAGIEPACSLIGDGTGQGHTDAKLFVFESCEYRRHFLAYKPDIAVITNIDFDHPDYFADIDDVRDAFKQMAAQTGKLVIACGDDPQVRMLQGNTPTLLYGFGSENDLRASGHTIEQESQSFDVHYKESFVYRFTIPSFGKHNVLNSLAVIGVALQLDLNMGLVKSHIATFSGVQRRFSEKQWGSNIVIDDYAHHPSEINATLDAVRSKYPQKKAVAIFQPHTFSRLEKLLEEFAGSLEGYDDVFLCEVFGSAREASGQVSTEHLIQLLPKARLISDNIATDLVAYEDAVLVFMGAGDIQKVQEQLFLNIH